MQPAARRAGRDESNFCSFHLSGLETLSSHTTRHSVRKSVLRNNLRRDSNQVCVKTRWGSVILQNDSVSLYNKLCNVMQIQLPPPIFSDCRQKWAEAFIATSLRAIIALMGSVILQLG